MPDQESQPLLSTRRRPSKRQRGLLKLRRYYQEPLAEFIATFFLVLIGDGVVAQSVLSSNANGSWLGINLAWAGAVFLGSYLAGPVTGSAINPAVTITLAVFGKFPWAKVPKYVGAQMLGGFLGAAAVYVNYRDGIEWFEGGHNNRTLKTAGIFATYPAPHLTSISSAFLSEFTAAWVLMVGISAISSKRSLAVKGSAHFAVFILMICIGSAFGWQTGYAINAARDLSPRIFTYFIYGSVVFTARNHYWWVPVVAPIAGCIVGAGTWNLFVGEDGEEEGDLVI